MSAKKIDANQIEIANAHASQCIEENKEKNAAQLKELASKIETAQPDLSDSQIQNQIRLGVDKELIANCEYYRKLATYLAIPERVEDPVVIDVAANACDMIDYRLEENSSLSITALDASVHEIVKHNSAKIEMKYNLKDAQVYDNFIIELKKALMYNCLAYRKISLIDQAKKSNQ